eukprot:6124093-Pleurochrysis_carterae.AAC.2
MSALEHVPHNLVRRTTLPWGMSLHTLETAGMLVRLYVRKPLHVNEPCVCVQESGIRDRSCMDARVRVCILCTRLRTAP